MPSKQGRGWVHAQIQSRPSLCSALFLLRSAGPGHALSDSESPATQPCVEFQLRGVQLSESRQEDLKSRCHCWPAGTTPPDAISKTTDVASGRVMKRCVLPRRASRAARGDAAAAKRPSHADPCRKRARVSEAASEPRTAERQLSLESRRRGDAGAHLALSSALRRRRPRGMCSISPHTPTFRRRHESHAMIGSSLVRSSAGCGAHVVPRNCRLETPSARSDSGFAVGAKPGAWSESGDVRPIQRRDRVPPRWDVVGVRG